MEINRKVYKIERLQNNMRKSISLESEFNEDRLTLPVLGGESIPFPFSKFGKSIDGILKKGGLILEGNAFIHDSELAELKRTYLHKNSGMKISYYHGIRIEDISSGELLPEVVKDRIELDSESAGWLTPVRFDPDLFYDLYSRDDFSSEYIAFDINRSYLSLSNGRGTILEYEKLKDSVGNTFNLARNKMFLVSGDIDLQDRKFYFPTNSSSTENFENGMHKIEDMYVSKNSVFKYLENVVSSLQK